MKSSSKKLFGAALALGLVANGAQAISAPSQVGASAFIAINEVSSPMDLIAHGGGAEHKCGEGKCGEGKCGAAKPAAKTVGEHKCGGSCSKAHGKKHGKGKGKGKGKKAKAAAAAAPATTEQK